MNEPRSTDRVARIAREIRFLKGYAIVSSLVLAVLLVAGFVQQATRFDEIDVERINIRNEDGGLALAIAGKGLLPGPTFEGTEYPQELSGGRVGASGMIFFNERGDEVGGLTYQGRTEGDGYRASGGIAFDQFRQDQVVALQYSDDGEQRSAGLQVWDRSPDISIAEILEIAQRRAEATGAARDSIDREIQELARRGLAASRVFLGSRDRNALLLLRDTRGRPRIRLVVDSSDAARLEFMDSTGTVTRAWPQ